MREKCPCCGTINESNEKIFKRDFSPCRLIVPFVGYDVFSCSKCGLYYAGNIEESMPLDDYYELMSRYEGGNYHSISPDLIELYRHVVRLIEKTVPLEADIMDVGCAFGGLLNELKVAGYCNLYGVEPSQENCDYAMDYYGIQVYQGELGDDIPELRQKKFDIIILCGVLEHLMDIHASIQQCRTMLKQGGRIIIVVPDVSLFCEHKDLYQEFSIEHINYFDKKSLQYLMNLEGYVFERLERSHINIMGLAGNSISLWRKAESDCYLNYKQKEYTDDTNGGMSAYLEQCADFATRMRKRMYDYDTGKGYYVWGAGTNTAMLVQLNIISEKLIKGVIDSNLNYTGMEVYGNRVLSPDELRAEECLPIVIASQYAYSAIEKKIKNMGLKNHIINLFSEEMDDDK